MSSTISPLALRRHEAISPTEELIAEAQAGRMFILVDDEDRENEGDLIIPAQFATPQALAFMMREARGLICLAMTSTQIDRLELPMMAVANQQRHQTAFTVSIDARQGVTTGVSARDRAHTIALAINPETDPADLVTPGHVFPLAARPGGALVRAGHTEAAVDLCKLAGLPQVAVICELANDDGTVMVGPEIVTFCDKHKLKRISVADLIAYRQSREKLVERVATFPVKTSIGELTGHAFRTRFDPVLHFAFVHGSIGDGRAVPARLHRADIIDDIFGGGLIDRVLKGFKEDGKGVLVYLRDGSAGVPANLSGAESLNADAARASQWREVGLGAQILRDLGVTSIRLRTNAPRKYVGLAGFGVEIAAIESIEG